MSLSVGIVGLPNVGKSTIFNALTRAQNAESANYPFCTIEPNKAIAPVPDERLLKLSDLAKPQKIIHTTVDVITSYSIHYTKLYEQVRLPLSM